MTVGAASAHTVRPLVFTCPKPLLHAVWLSQNKYLVNVPCRSSADGIHGQFERLAGWRNRLGAEHRHRSGERPFHDADDARPLAGSELDRVLEDACV